MGPRHPRGLWRCVGKAGSPRHTNPDVDCGERYISINTLTPPTSVDNVHIFPTPHHGLPIPILIYTSKQTIHIANPIQYLADRLKSLPYRGGRAHPQTPTNEPRGQSRPARPLRQLANSYLPALGASLPPHAAATGGVRRLRSPGQGSGGRGR